MELGHYIEVLRRRWWLLLLGPIVAGAIAYSVSESQTDIYQAETTLLVNHTETEGTIQLDDVLASERLTKTYAQLITQRPMLSGVIEELNLGYTESELQASLSVDPIVDTQLLRIRAKDADPVVAATIANTLSKDFITTVETGQERVGTVTVVEAASPPTGRIAPRVMLNTAMAIVVGLLVAVGIVVVLESLREKSKSPDDEPVKSADDVTKLGLMPLMVVPQFTKLGSKNGHAATVSASWLDNELLAETYRFLRTNVEFATIARGAQVLLVASANPLEGKSTTATNLAVAMAKGGHKTILIDANLRSPSLHRTFGISNERGLATLLLADDVSLRNAVMATEVPQLSLIPAGPAPHNVADLLSSGAMRRLVECIRELWDVIIIDSPAMNSVADASLLAREADATVLVVEADKTRRHSVMLCLESLRMAQAADTPANEDTLFGQWRTSPPAQSKTVGAVLNKMTRRNGHRPYGVER